MWGSLYLGTWINVKENNDCRSRLSCSFISSPWHKLSLTGLVSTFAGSVNFGNVDGLGTAALFFSPTGLAFSVSGDLLVSDADNNQIRSVTSAG